jgi:hypothetical protein
MRAAVRAADDALGWWDGQARDCVLRVTKVLEELGRGGPLRRTVSGEAPDLELDGLVARLSADPGAGFRSAVPGDLAGLARGWATAVLAERPSRGWDAGSGRPDESRHVFIVERRADGTLVAVETQEAGGGRFTEFDLTGRDMRWQALAGGPVKMVKDSSGLAQVQVGRAGAGGPAAPGGSPAASGSRQLDALLDPASGRPGMLSRVFGHGQVPAQVQKDLATVRAVLGWPEAELSELTGALRNLPGGSRNPRMARGPG